MMTDDLKDILYSEEMIRQRVMELGGEITKDYSGKKPLLIGVLKGCFIFLADIVRYIDLECEIRFIVASSYGFASVTSGIVSIGSEFDFEIEDRDILIIEDILDTGVTMTTLQNLMMAKNPSSLRICTMLDKPTRRKVSIDADYIGFQCPDEFLVGYGLDYAERYRNLPYIASLKQEIYSKKYTRSITKNKER